VHCRRAAKRGKNAAKQGQARRWGMAQKSEEVGDEVAVR
jgi:hypothetical protein